VNLQKKIAMKIFKILFFIGLMVTGPLAFGQVDSVFSQFVGTVDLQNFISGGTGDVVGDLNNFSDQSNRYFANDIAVGDIVWDNQRNRWRVDAVNSSNLINANVDLTQLNASGDTPFGRGFVTRESETGGFSALPPDNSTGISQQLKSAVETHNWLKLAAFLRDSISVASGRSIQTITADGTDTLDFGGLSYATDYWQIDLNAVTTSTINFTNPNTSIVPTYNLHFLSDAPDTVNFASTFLDANLDTITQYIFSQGQIVPMYYASGNYYTTSLNIDPTTPATLTLPYSSDLLYAFVRDSLITEDVNGVSLWGDLSGNNRDAVQSDNAKKPTTDGSENIVFDGTDDRLIVDTALWTSVQDSALSFIIVFTPTDTVTRGKIWEIGPQRSAHDPHFFGNVFFEKITGTETVSLTATFIDGAGVNQAADFDTLNVNTAYLVSYLSSETTNFKVRVNGTELVDRSVTAGYSNIITNASKSIGSAGSGTADFSPAKVLFFAAYKKKLSDAEAANVESTINSWLSIY
jgi:hypothetical protein